MGADRSPTTPSGAGKARANEQLGAPGGAGLQSPLSGNIGSSNGSPSGARQSSRTTVGGVRVETRYVFCGHHGTVTQTFFINRYTGVDTLDEPVTTTIVSTSYSFSLNY